MIFRWHAAVACAFLWLIPFALCQTPTAHRCDSALALHSKDQAVQVGRIAYRVLATSISQNSYTAVSERKGKEILSIKLLVTNLSERKLSVPRLRLHPAADEVPSLAAEDLLIRLEAGEFDVLSASANELQTLLSRWGRYGGSGSDLFTYDWGLANATDDAIRRFKRAAGRQEAKLRSLLDKVSSELRVYNRTREVVPGRSRQMRAYFVLDGLREAWTSEERVYLEVASPEGDARLIALNPAAQTSADEEACRDTEAPTASTIAPGSSDSSPSFSEGKGADSISNDDHSSESTHYGSPVSDSESSQVIEGGLFVSEARECLIPLLRMRPIIEGYRLRVEALDALSPKPSPYEYGRLLPKLIGDLLSETTVNMKRVTDVAKSQHEGIRAASRELLGNLLLIESRLRKMKSLLSEIGLPHRPSHELIQRIDTLLTDILGLAQKASISRMIDRALQEGPSESNLRDLRSSASER